MINNYNNILVLAPHTDDGELGMGGTISHLVELGKKVTYVAFSTAQQSVPEGFPKDILKTEVKKATAKLGILPENLIIYNYEVRKLGYVRQEILEELIRLRKANHFDLVFMPSLHVHHCRNESFAETIVESFCLFQYPNRSQSVRRTNELPNQGGTDPSPGNISRNRSKTQTAQQSVCRTAYSCKPPDDNRKRFGKTLPHCQYTRRND